LYDWNETLQEFYDRLKFLLNFNVIIKPMRFIDLCTGEYKNGYGKNISQKVANFFNNCFVNGMMRKGTEKLLGKDLNHWLRICDYVIKFRKMTGGRALLTSYYDDIIKQTL
jgi:hypothetical protein